VTLVTITKVSLCFVQTSNLFTITAHPQSHPDTVSSPCAGCTLAMDLAVLCFPDDTERDAARHTPSVASACCCRLRTTSVCPSRGCAACCSARNQPDSPHHESLPPHQLSHTVVHCWRRAGLQVRCSNSSAGPRRRPQRHSARTRTRMAHRPRWMGNETLQWTLHLILRLQPEVDGRTRGHDQ